MPTQTRERLIETAIRRFYRDGFRNVGIDQVLADVGISKTAFYKHFESKEALMLAALATQNQWLQSTFRQMVRERGRTAVEQLRALFDVVEILIESDDFHGCLFVNVSMEFPLPHDPAHVLASQSKAAIEDFVHTLAEAARAGDPRGLAQELCLLMEGAYVTKHVSNKKNTVDIARRLADVVIESRCPAVTPTASSDGR